MKRSPPNNNNSNKKISSDMQWLSEGGGSPQVAIMGGGGKNGGDNGKTGDKGPGESGISRLLGAAKLQSAPRGQIIHAVGELGLRRSVPEICIRGLTVYGIV